MTMRAEPKQARAGAALAVIGVHALILFALASGLHVEVPRLVSDDLKLFEISPPPPSPAPEAPAPAPKAVAKAEAPSPPNLRHRPTPVVAPPREVAVPVPTPVVAAPVAGTGSEAEAGASDRAGPGFGSGGAGAGSGGGGGARRAQLVSGRISDADYPRRASRERAGGTVEVRFTVGPEGRASGCTIAASSGNAELDATTCRLIERRFRYEPARDPAGQPIAEQRGWRQTWWLEPRG